MTRSLCDLYAISPQRKKDNHLSLAQVDVTALSFRMLSKLSPFCHSQELFISKYLLHSAKCIYRKVLKSEQVRKGWELLCKHFVDFVIDQKLFLENVWQLPKNEAFIKFNGWNEEESPFSRWFEREMSQENSLASNDDMSKWRGSECVVVATAASMAASSFRTLLSIFRQIKVDHMRKDKAHVLQMDSNQIRRKL